MQFLKSSEAYLQLFTSCLFDLDKASQDITCHVLTLEILDQSQRSSRCIPGKTWGFNSIRVTSRISMRNLNEMLLNKSRIIIETGGYKPLPLPRKLEKRWVLFGISLSNSQVASSDEWLVHKTLTKEITLFLNTFSFRSKILFGYSLYWTFGVISTSWGFKTCEESLTYFRSIETWNTSCTAVIDSGKDRRYARAPTCSRISKGTMSLGLSFSFLPNLIIPRNGETFKNTFSPTSNSKGLHLLSA